MWCRPEPSSVSPIYIPGRRRTASSPRNTLIESAPYASLLAWSRACPSSSSDAFGSSVNLKTFFSGWGTAARDRPGATIRHLPIIARPGCGLHAFPGLPGVPVALGPRAKFPLDRGAAAVDNEALASRDSLRRLVATGQEFGQG